MTNTIDKLNAIDEKLTEILMSDSTDAFTQDMVTSMIKFWRTVLDERDIQIAIASDADK